ncbi:hypothetical protein SCAR479_01467 [Seiridium cardinale]|uniref:Uncharacterized protein n=1 Tax=Seiridium cardinale TaxID=138064 RepID=A0ABR2Y5V5_9PEZI
MFINTMNYKLNPKAQVFEPGVPWYASWMIQPAHPTTKMEDNRDEEWLDEDIHKPIAKHGDLYASVHCTKKTIINSLFEGGEKKQIKKHGGLSASRWGKGAN